MKSVLKVLVSFALIAQTSLASAADVPMNPQVLQNRISWLDTNLRSAIYDFEEKGLKKDFMAEMEVLVHAMPAAERLGLIDTILERLNLETKDKNSYFNSKIVATVVLGWIFLGLAEAYEPYPGLRKFVYFVGIIAMARSWTTLQDAGRNIDSLRTSLLTYRMSLVAQIQAEQLK